MRTIIYALLLLAVVAGGFYAYQRFIVPTPSDDVLVSEETGAAGLNGSQASEVSDLLRILQTLRGLSINTQLFERPTYQALRDFSVTVRVQPQGRTNPFAAF